MKNELTIAIISKNAEKTIEKTLRSIEGMGRVIVIDNMSTDDTRKITEKYTKDIIESEASSFADKRNLALNRHFFRTAPKIEDLGNGRVKLGH